MRVSLAGLAGGAAASPPLDDAGRLTDPVVIVDLDGSADPALLRAARDAAAGAGRILVGVLTREEPGEPARGEPGEPGEPGALSRDTPDAPRRDASDAPRRDASGALGWDEPGALGWDEPGALSRGEPGALSRDAPGARSRGESGALSRDAQGALSRDAQGEAWRDLLAALDVTFSVGEPSRFCVPAADPWAEARVLHAAAAARPQAAAVLAQVLRASEGLDVRRALDVESFAYSTLLGGAEFRAWLAARGPRPLPPPAPAPPVLVERTGDRLLITLNRPERRNAYGRELRDALADALRVAVLDGGIAAVTLAGAGPSFCSGGDLDEFGTTPDIATAHFVRTRGGAAELLHRLAPRAEVRLHGACVGAGIELAAFAGRVVARAGTTVRLPEAGMGLIPGAGGTVSIPRRIGRWRTFALALCGRELDAATAARWGLIDEIAV